MKLKPKFGYSSAIRDRHKLVLRLENMVVNWAFSFLVAWVLLVGCSAPSADNLNAEKAKEDTSRDILFEVKGLCEVDGKVDVCDVDNTPKFYRQIVDYDIDLSYGGYPNTIGPFTVLKHIEAGYLIPEKIGYKYKRLHNPGEAGIVKFGEGLSKDATLYEVFLSDMSTHPKLDVGRLVARGDADVSETCVLKNMIV